MLLNHSSVKKKSNWILQTMLNWKNRKDIEMYESVAKAMSREKLGWMPKWETKKPLAFHRTSLDKADHRNPK